MKCLAIAIWIGFYDINSIDNSYQKKGQVWFNEPSLSVFNMDILITIFITLFTEHFVSFEHGLLFLNLVTRQAFPVLNIATKIWGGTALWFIGTKYFNVSYNIQIHISLWPFSFTLTVTVDLIDLERLQTDSTLTRMQCWTMFCTAEHTQVSDISVMGHLVNALSACHSATCTTIMICTSLLQICWSYK